MTHDAFNQKVDAFISKYIDKSVGYPTNNEYRGECLSVVKWYMKELWGFNPPSSGVNSAYGYWTNFPAPLGNYFDKIPNTPTGVPQKGDVVIWKGALVGSDGAGHIAIATGKGDTNSFEAFGQNWGGKNAHHVTYKYTNVYGWLRPKNINDAPPPVPNLPPVDPKDIVIADLNKKLIETTNTITTLTNDKSTLEGVVASNKTTIEDLSIEQTKLQEELKNLDIEYTTLQNTNSDLLKANEDLKKGIFIPTWANIFDLIIKKIKGE
jgi:hypothetical protein